MYNEILIGVLVIIFISTVAGTFFLMYSNPEQQIQQEPQPQYLNSNEQLNYN